MQVNDSVGKTEVLLQFNGTGAATARDALNTGTQKMSTEHPVFGCLNIGITLQYKHLGSVNAGPHTYDQEIESRVGQAQNTNKAFRRIFVCKQRDTNQRQINGLKGPYRLQTHLSRSNLGHAHGGKFEND